MAESKSDSTSNFPRTEVNDLLNCLEDHLTLSECGNAEDDGNGDGENVVTEQEEDHENVAIDQNPTVILTARNISQVLRFAVQVLNRADQQEKQNSTAEAFKLYKDGIGLLLKVYKVPGLDSKLKENLKTKAELFLSKAEHLKEHLDHNKNSDDCHQCGPNKAISQETKKSNEFFESYILEDSFRRHLNEVKGQTHAVQSFKELLILPIKFPQFFTGMCRRRQILLFGHAGTGKTILMAGTAGELADFQFMRISVWDLTSRFLSCCPERAVKDLFQFIREKAPCVVFVEDIEKVEEDCRDDEESRNWRKMKTEFLVQLESLHQDPKVKENKLVVVFVTQRPWILSGSFRKRMDTRIFCDLPTKQDRIEIMKSALTGVCHNLTQEDFDQVADRTLSAGGNRFTQADLLCLCRDAMMQSVRKIQEAQYFKQIPHPESGEEGFWTPCCHGDSDAVEMSWTQLEGTKLLEPEIEMSDFLHSLQNSKGTVDPEAEALMQQWVDDFTGYRS